MRPARRRRRSTGCASTRSRSSAATTATGAGRTRRCSRSSRALATLLPEDSIPQPGTTTTCRSPNSWTATGMRALELDVYNDPEGGQFYNRQGLRSSAAGGLEHPRAARAGAEGVAHPGLRLRDPPLHLPLGAARRSPPGATRTPSTCRSAIHIETKEGTIADALPALWRLTTAVPFDAAAAAAIDAEIRAVFAEPVPLITPDEVRGAHATLEEAVLAGGWPTLAAARGRILFFMEGAARRRIRRRRARAGGAAGVRERASPGDRTRRS